MERPIDTDTTDGVTLKFFHDQDCSSPRENDNIGTIIAWHRRYNLSDDDAPKISDPSGFDPNGYAICLPVYMYEHSGVALSTGTFSCPWDSGQVGWIFVTREKLLKEYDCKRITKKVREQAIAGLKSEIEEYGRYVNGECYGYVVEDEDTHEQIDSCWGFIGYDYVKQEGERAQKDAIADRTKKADEHTDAQRSEN